MKIKTFVSGVTAGAMLLTATPIAAVRASSHMDAPLITLDDPANTTDVYAFRSESNGIQYLTTALAVYPFEEPGIGPNNYRFDDNVLYEIHVALGDDIDDGEATFSYQFQFSTTFANDLTTLQAYLGVIADGNCGANVDFTVNQNLMQTYTVTKVDDDDDDGDVLGEGLMVPPNNQGLVTPCYNEGDDGEMPARGGVGAEVDLDAYTFAAVNNIADNYRVFAGQRDDGFYADIQSIFDLDFTFGGPNKPFDSQGGFNLHTIVLNIPLSEFGGAEIAGVYATTSRPRTLKLSKKPEKKDDKISGEFIQVARQGNPLFAEALVAVVDKDLYNRTSPTRDADLFSIYASAPELASVLTITPLDSLVGSGKLLVEDIFIPDLIKVDLTTGPANLAGDVANFNRLSVFGGDTLTTSVPESSPYELSLLGLAGQVPGGWPNGRRFGDDVLDIALFALGLDPAVTPNPDRVTANDITFNDVFPYAATPLNGRNHPHHGAP